MVKTNIIHIEIEMVKIMVENNNYGNSLIRR